MERLEHKTGMLTNHLRDSASPFSVVLAVSITFVYNFFIFLIGKPAMRWEKQVINQIQYLRRIFYYFSVYKRTLSKFISSLELKARTVIPFRHTSKLYSYLIFFLLFNVICIVLSHVLMFSVSFTYLIFSSYRFKLLLYLFSHNLPPPYS
jgi:hypothetical protein